MKAAPRRHKAIWKRLSWVAALVPLVLLNVARGDTLRTARIFADHMVVQQDLTLPVWGWGEPGQDVTVALAGQTQTTRVAADGSWRVSLGATPAGGPHELLITGRNPAAEVKAVDVLVGEVWLCSGQSNMAWPVRAASNAETEMAAARYPQIRHARIANVSASEPQQDCEAAWAVCSPAMVGEFTATGYYFARELHQRLHVPIGLIQSSWGGTVAEAWTSQEALAEQADLRPILERFAETVKTHPAELRLYQRRLAQAEAMRKEGKTLPECHEDPGNQGAAQGWQNTEFDDARWCTVPLPERLENIWGADFDGAAWFRKRVEIPSAWAGRDLVLTLGAIDDLDVTYFNGEPVGRTGLDVPFFWIAPRQYRVPGRLVQAGPAVVAVRVFDHFGAGMFLGPASDMKLGVAEAAGQDGLTLAGPWRCQVEVRLDPLEIRGPGGPQAPMGPDNPGAPARLYNAMIHPLAPYALRGAIWYQGEANTGRAHQYRSLLPALIEGWRRRWGQDDLPFYIVQLPNFKSPQAQPGESEWAEMREAQQMTEGRKKNSAVACTIDVGDANNIHPANKQEVGRRLALVALARTYGRDLVCSGPRYRKMAIEGETVRLWFESLGGGLTVRGDKLTGFAIAGADRQFVWADAALDGDTVVVSNLAVRQPVAVRYAWADNPDCNLYNREGLPALPFRTDDWQGVTFGRQ